MPDPHSRKPTSLSAHGFRIQSMMEEEGGAEVLPLAPVPGPGAGADWVSLNNLSGDAAPGSGDGLASVADLAPPPSAPTTPPLPGVQDRVVHALHRKGTVTPADVEQALQVKRQQNLRDPLWRVLAELKDVDRDAVYAQAALTYAFRIAPIREREPDADFVRTVMESLPDANRDALIRLNVAPYAYAQEQATGLLKIVFITDDPMRQDLQRTMNALELERLELCYAPREVVSGVLREAFPRKNEYLERVHESAEGAFDMGVSFESGERSLIDEDALEAEISRSALINLVEGALLEAVRIGASDIHIYPNAQRKVEIHFRVDGRLRHWHT
jgi:type IV pilus assembly protein PilB